MNTSLTSLNQEFKEYENINIDFDVLDFWRQLEKNFPILSQRLCVQGDFFCLWSGYTV
jgi:hypothetical protein